MKEVTIIQRILPQYRIDFFEGLRDSLKREGVKLQLVYGGGDKNDALKKDEVELNWAKKIKNHRYRIFSTNLYWQPCLSYIKKSELIIVEQANKNLINYLLLFSKLFNKKKVAFWGHGLNRQDQKNSLSNRFKQKFINSSDWWFAYTSSVKDYLANNNYPEDQITIVQNAINTTKIENQSKKLLDFDLDKVKAELAIQSDNIGIYCGGIYSEKRIPFLIQSTDLVRKKITDFHLIIIGSGEEVELLKGLISDKPWIHYLGPKFEEEKIRLFKISKVFLMPGLVGLAILDAFATTTPLITTRYPFHSPEIEYLENNFNGIITKNDVGEYADKVVQVLSNQSLLQKLRSGCELSSKKYTLEQMVNNFKNGILNCLNTIE